ncbi:MAG: type II secretion system protein GspG [Gemmataceae bacterium]
MRRGGLTLMELLVVLLVLAVMTTIAIRATENVVQQARYDAAQRGLLELRQAIIGPDNERDLDGTLLITGFVADVGRLPKASGNSPTTQLAELWSNPFGLAAFGIKPASTDSGDHYRRHEVFVPCGWRGSYLRLPIGMAELRDGWGNPYVLLQADNSPASADAPITWIRSLGADNTAGGTDYNTDVEIASTPPLTINAAITVTVRLAPDDMGVPMELDDEAKIVVKCFGPDPATGGVDGQIDGGKDSCKIVDIPSGSTSVTVTVNTTIGPRTIRAYQVKNPMGEANDDVTALSDPVRLMVRPGGQAKDVIIRPK